MTPRQYQRLRDRAEAVVEAEAMRFCHARHADMVGRGWDPGDAWDAIITWARSDVFAEFANQRLREETRRLIDPRAPSVALQ